MSANRLVRVRVPVLRAETLEAQLGRSLYLVPGDDINLAIAALDPTPASPAAVVLAPGTYVSDAISMLPGLSIIGAGAGQSTVLAPVSFPRLGAGTAADNTMVLKGVTLSVGGRAIDTSIGPGLADRRIILENVAVEGAGRLYHVNFDLIAADQLELCGSFEVLSSDGGNRGAIIHFNGAGTAVSTGTIKVVHSGTASQATAAGVWITSSGSIRLNSLVLEGCTLVFHENGFTSQQFIGKLSVDSSQMTVPPVLLSGVTRRHIQVVDSTFIRDTNYADAAGTNAISSRTLAGNPDDTPADTVLSLGRVKWVRPGGVPALLFGGVTNMAADEIHQ